MRTALPLALLVACSSSSGAPPAATPAAAPAQDDASDSTAAAATPSDAPLTEDDCVALFDHLIDIKLDELRASVPPDQVPTDEQVEEIRERMRSEEMPRCLAGDRQTFACALAATTAEDVAACGSGQDAPP